MSKGKSKSEDGPGATTTQGVGTATETVTDVSPETDGCARATTTTGGVDRPLDEGELRTLLGRAERGDRSVLPALRTLLDASPGLWRACSDIAQAAESAWVGVVAGVDLLVNESLTRRVAELKVELGGPSPTPLERLLVDRVVLCWIQCNQADAALSQARGKRLTTAQLTLMERRCERTQKSYLAAIKALATVRKLQPGASGGMGVEAGPTDASGSFSNRDKPDPIPNQPSAPARTAAAGSRIGDASDGPTRKFSLVKDEE